MVKIKKSIPKASSDMAPCMLVTTVVGSGTTKTQRQEPNAIIANIALLPLLGWQAESPA